MLCTTVEVCGHLQSADQQMLVLVNHHRNRLSRSHTWAACHGKISIMVEAIGLVNPLKALLCVGRLYRRTV